MEWIKVSDRLPEYREKVLVYCKNGGPIHIYLTAHYYWVHDFLSIENQNFTHWMPLPKPPTE